MHSRTGTDSDPTSSLLQTASAQGLTILLVGHFATNRPGLDGQTIKTRLTLTELKLRLGDKAVKCIDTGATRRKPLRAAFSFFTSVGNATDVVIMPGQRHLLTMWPIYAAINKLTKARLHYVVIGGWLPQMIASRSGLRRALAAFTSIFVESQRMHNALRKLALTNVIVVPNYRRFSYDRKTSGDTSQPLRLVFASRITPSKGVEAAVSAVQRLNLDRESKRATLDVWGPINDVDASWFQGLQLTFGDDVRYCGVVQPERMTDVLSGYDCMLFPTTYQGEGLAGVIVEAFIAGIPVVATNWQDNSELVQHGSTGMLFEPGDDDALGGILDLLSSNPIMVDKMKAAAADRARVFHVEGAFTTMLSKLLEASTSEGN